jgi:TolA-binding protein
MIRVNEAYVAVLADLTVGGADPGPVSRQPQTAETGRPATTRAVGNLRDPAYVYYKAGFRAYNEGSTMLYRKEGRELRRFLQTGGTFDAYVLGLVLQALQQFERSYRYFLVVVEQYPHSPWYADARWKLYRLERYNAIYQRICENLSRRSSTRRSSFSMVAGADPS